MLLVVDEDAVVLAPVLRGGDGLPTSPLWSLRMLLDPLLRRSPGARAPEGTRVPPLALLPLPLPFGGGEKNDDRGALMPGLMPGVMGPDPAFPVGGPRYIWFTTEAAWTMSELARRWPWPPRDWDRPSGMLGAVDGSSLGVVLAGADTVGGGIWLTGLDLTFGLVDPATTDRAL